MNQFPAMSTPRSVGIALTGRCNLKCKYCYYANEMVALSDLPTEIWLRFFEELAELGVMDTILTGGEVFTHPHLFELIDGIIANHMRYTLLTNGTLITEKTIEKLLEGKRRLRLDHIQLSLDGSSAEVHDLTRPNSFARALRGLKLLQAADLPLLVRITINRHNLYDLENTAELLLDEIGLRQIGTNDAMPIGAGCDSQGELALSYAEKKIAGDILDRLQARYPGRLSAMAGPQANARMYGKMEEARRTGVKTESWMGTLSSCGPVFERIEVLHDGSIVPCALLHELKLGNIQTDSFGEIWRTHPVLVGMRERRAIPLQDVPGCGGCEWASYCSGGCPALAYYLNGKNLNQIDPTSCYRRFLQETKEYHGLPH
jgi:SynChlorMet cassette radical SAM/SPASM protein ScmE